MIGELYFVQFLKIITGNTHTKYCGAVVGEETMERQVVLLSVLSPNISFPEISGQCPCWFKCSPLVARVGFDQTVRITFSATLHRSSVVKETPFCFL